MEFQVNRKRWKHGYESGFQVVRTDEPFSKRICTLERYLHGADPEHDRNAKLIAAVPRLIEVVEDLVTLLREQYHNGHDLLFSEYDEAKQLLEELDV